MRSPTARQIRIAAVFAFVPLLVAAGVVLTDRKAMPIMSHGPLQAGHSDVRCESCHVPSAGTVRQQLQAKVRFGLGMRDTRVDFGYGAVTSKACLQCHERPNERHPIFRFHEPRFEKAVTQVEATSCLGCHAEHTTHRTTVDLVFCQACHDDLALKSDPLDVDHATLIADRRWQTCLGCHDFHGNHSAHPPKALEEAFAPLEIEAYLRAGPSPYALPKNFEAKEDLP
ncbi:Doubled CXXCH motif [Shimia sp. SK013]|uniref:cytochrome c3 family protein n=1 Tax=Shimia sp. SK013 TaxID=1389006 RepID=UPI0006B43C3D|nr:cytochrome c3 family protein [Shimia sp. SK013]KPA22689.1 Doubled CXXCH motif [Shimia sp. SK013]